MRRKRGKIRRLNNITARSVKSGRHSSSELELPLVVPAPSRLLYTLAAHQSFRTVAQEGGTGAGSQPDAATPTFWTGPNKRRQAAAAGWARLLGSSLVDGHNRRSSAVCTVTKQPGSAHSVAIFGLRQCMQVCLTLQSQQAMWRVKKSQSRQSIMGKVCWNHTDWSFFYSSI